MNRLRGQLNSTGLSVGLAPRFKVFIWEPSGFKMNSREKCVDKQIPPRTYLVSTFEM